MRRVAKLHIMRVKSILPSFYEPGLQRSGNSMYKGLSSAAPLLHLRGEVTGHFARTSIPAAPDGLAPPAGDGDNRIGTGSERDGPHRRRPSWETGQDRPGDDGAPDWGGRFSQRRRRDRIPSRRPVGVASAIYVWLCKRRFSGASVRPGGTHLACAAGASREAPWVLARSRWVESSPMGMHDVCRRRRRRCRRRQRCFPAADDLSARKKRGGGGGSGDGGDAVPSFRKRAK